MLQVKLLLCTCTTALTCPDAAGAAGLASALRGTVRQALDAYQTRSALHLHSRHSRHSSAGSIGLGSLRSALGAGPVPAAAAASPWQQQQLLQQLSQQLQPRVSWAGVPLSPVATPGARQGSAGFSRVAEASRAPAASRLNRLSNGSGSQVLDAAAAAAAGEAAAAGSSKGSVGRLVLHTSKGQKSPQAAAAAQAPAAAAPAAGAAGMTVPSQPAGTVTAALSSIGVLSSNGSQSNAAAGSSMEPFELRSSGAAHTRVSSASSWSDFEAVGVDAAGADGSKVE